MRDVTLPPFVDEHRPVGQRPQACPCRWYRTLEARGGHDTCPVHPNDDPPGRYLQDADVRRRVPAPSGQGWSTHCGGRPAGG